MNFPDDDDSVFEQALRADLPSMAEQNRLRQRLLAAGVAAGTALGSTNVAAATQSSFGATALSKLSALSWPAKFGLTVALAAPVAAVPLVYTPVHAAELVRQVQSSAAAVHARSTAKALSLAPLPQRPAQPSPLAEPAQNQQTRAEPESSSQANLASRAATPRPTDLPTPAVATPSSAVDTSAASAGPAVAAFDAPGGDAQSARNASTLAAETQLLDRAFAALAAGDRSTASALVAEHARRFPSGLLRQERERARARLATDPKGE